MAVLLRGLGIP